VPAPIGPRAPDDRRGGSAAGEAARAPRAPAARHGGPSQSLGDRRGLTATGALLLALLLTGAGAVLDAVVGQRQLWLLFTIGFVLSSGLCAQRVHREDLGTSVLLPPIVYAVVVAVAAYGGSRSSSGLRQQVLDASTAMILHTPILLGGTLLAAVVALRRGASYRRRDRWSRRG